MNKMIKGLKEKFFEENIKTTEIKNVNWFFDKKGKWQTYDLEELKDKYLNKQILWREVLENEVVLDIDIDGEKYTQFEKIQMSAKLCLEISNFLDENDLKYYIGFSGNKGFHIHLFFKNKEDKNKLINDVILLFPFLDPSMFFKQKQLIREFFSYNEKSGMYKFFVKKEDLETLSQNGMNILTVSLQRQNLIEKIEFNESYENVVKNKNEEFTNTKFKEITVKEIAIEKKKKNKKTKTKLIKNNKSREKLNKIIEHIKRHNRIEDCSLVKTMNEHTGRVWLVNWMLELRCTVEEILDVFQHFDDYDEIKTKKYISWVIEKRIKDNEKIGGDEKDFLCNELIKLIEVRPISDKVKEELRRRGLI